MKKNLITLVALLCAFSLTSKAQEWNVSTDNTSPGGDSDKGFTMGIGVRGGLTFTSLSGDVNENNGEFYDGSGMGFVGGVFINFRFGKAKSKSLSWENKVSYSGTGYLGLEIGASYKQLVAKTLDADESKLTINNFELPVMIQFYPACNVKGIKNLYIEGGVAIAGTMGVKPDYITVMGTRYNTGEIKGFDIRPAAGLGWRHESGIGVSGRYYFGSSELAENFPLKTNTLEVALTYKFNVAGNKSNKVKGN